MQTCWLKTKGENYKKYIMSIENQRVQLARPKSSKQKALSYDLKQVQCVVGRNQSQLDSETGSEDTKHCLLLISSPSQQRSIFFSSVLALKWWHIQILKVQGFLDNRADQYEPIRKLCEGSFGKVILASHKLSGVLVAVKSISKSTIFQAFTLNGQKYEEIEIMEKICRGMSPHLLDLIEAFEDSDSFFIVTKFMQGMDLQSYLSLPNAQPRDEALARHLMSQLVEGVHAMHSLDIVHRDLKLENVLMADSKPLAKLKISDFGSSFTMTNGKLSRFRIGTPGYTSPELIQGLAYGKSVDIFALGCMLHVMLTFQVPFWHENKEKRSQRVCEEPIDVESPELFWLTPACKDLLKKLLTKDPAQRPTIQQVMDHEWF